MRKKLVLLMSLLFIIGMSACSNNDEQEAHESDSPTKTEQEDANETEGKQKNQVATDDDTEATDEHNNVEEDIAIPAELADFEEAAILSQHIELDQVTADIKTDNSNKRIILFADGNHKVYKSIFIKHDNHLKVIHLQDDDLMYNDQIK